jgi:tetratricopeptide (TPR) repeat protein
MSKRTLEANFRGRTNFRGASDRPFLASKPRTQLKLSSAAVGTLQPRAGQDGSIDGSHPSADAPPDTNAFVDSYIRLGNILLDQGNHDDALEVYRGVLAVRPDSAEAHHRIGIVLRELGRLLEAREAAEQATRLSPRHPAYFRNLAELKRFVAGEPLVKEIEALADNAASFSAEERIELHFLLAKIYEDLGHYEQCFGQLQAGNALKRELINYDEQTVLGAFERVRAVFTPELIRTRRGAGEASRVPVFIIGMIRSGTTLVEQIIASHPKTFGAGELKSFGNLAAGVHAKQHGAPAFPEVVTRMTGEDFRKLGARYLAKLSPLAPAAARITNKMPSNHIFAGLIHLSLPNAPIIHVVRDPVDTCMSCFSKLFKEGQHFSYDLVELGRYYRYYRALMAHWRDVLPSGRILDVHYEDLVGDLEGTARRIIAYCGLEWDPRCLAFHQTNRPVCTASVVQVRQPIYANAVGRWRHYERHLGPLLAELSL